MFLSSKDSIPYFSENKPHHFTVYLPEPLLFKPNSWTVSLLELEFSYFNIQNNKNIEIYSDITNESLIHGKKRRILRKVSIQPVKDQDTTINKNFLPVIPLLVNGTEIVSITIYICDEFGIPAAFLKDKTDCTLEFRPSKSRSIAKPN
jgi:hypothetical protein